MIKPETATLAKQSYGITMAQGIFGGPRGVWLECTEPGCLESDRITNSNSAEWCETPDAIVAQVFRRHGWSGDTDRMLKAKCPACARAQPRF